MHTFLYYFVLSLYRTLSIQTSMINGEHFTPAAAYLVDSIVVGRRGAVDKATETRQKQFLEFTEQWIDVVLRLECLHRAFVHMLK